MQSRTEMTKREFNRQKCRTFNAMDRYGITFAEYQRRMKAANGKCFICGPTDKRLVLDHNHKTHQIREVLCVKCNIRAGFVEKGRHYSPVYDVRVYRSYLDSFNGR